MQEICKNCAHSVKEGLFGEWYCRYVTKRDIFGRERNITISPYDTCDNFVARPQGPKGRSDCFLTSACVEYLGKADDCEELTKLRAFRDGYIMGLADGKQLVDEYYTIAPSIVKKIDESQDRDKHYAYIYDTITKCLASIDEGDNEKALALYKAMVVALQEL